MEELSQQSDPSAVPKATIAIGIEPTQVPAEPATVPPPVAPSSPTSSKHTTIFWGIGLAVILIVFAVFGGYMFYVLPRQNVVKLVTVLKPQVSTLKTSTTDLVAVMSKLYTLVTTETTPATTPNLNTTGIILHPEIASLRVGPSVLGAFTGTPQTGMLERNLLIVSQFLKGTLATIGHGSTKVAGASTSTEDPAVRNLRAVKDETVTADDSVGKAQSTLTQLLMTTKTLPAMMPSDAKAKIGGSVPLNISVSAYFSEAKKVADYYQTMCDMLISMNTKIDSFKTSIQSASATFGSMFAANAPNQPASVTIAQAQVFLDQAKKDMTDLKTLSEKLKTIPTDQLPYASTDYHTHNIKELDTVTTYFATESAILQGLFDSANVMEAKSQQNKVTMTDIVGFRNTLLTDEENAQLADTHFVSDLQALIGEEHTLTISFWENNTRLTTGPKVLQDIDAYQSSLDKVRQENTLSFLPQ